MTTPDTQELIEALEPCPLCGLAAEIWRAHPENPKRKAWIACTGKCCIMTREYLTDEEAIAAWNTRARSADEQRYRHKVRGTEYTVLGEAEVQTEYAVYEGAKLVIYRGDDGKIWARPTFEFYGGRFERVEAASARISAGDKDRENPVERPGNGEDRALHLSGEREKVVAWLLRHYEGELSANFHTQQTAKLFADALSRGDHISGDGR